MSYRVEYQANNGKFETLVFGNEEAAKKFASTKKLAAIEPVADDAPDVAVKQLAPKGKALTLARKARAHKARLEGKKPAAAKSPAERAIPAPSGFSLTDFLRERLAKKEAA